MRDEGQKTRQISRREIVPNASSLNNSTRRSSTDDQMGHEPKRTVEVDFLELRDGTLVELIENPHDATKSLLATWKNGHVRYVEKLQYGNQVFVPIPKDAELIRHVRLANGIEPYESVKSLLGDIMAICHLTLEVSAEQMLLLGAFVLSDWLVEKLPIAPYVAFVGPPGSGKTTALRILSLLCRRSLLTADISSAAFYELCDRMNPTLLIDETATVDNRREILHLLRVGTTQGFVAVRKSSTFKSYGARVVSWVELPDDAALNSRCLLIPMKRCERRGLLTPADPRILQVTEKLQRQLLQFRLMKFKTLALPQISGEETLQPRTGDVFRALALPLAEEKEVCEVLLTLLQQQESLRNVLSVQQSAVLECLYEAIHSSPEPNGLRTVALTEIVNANLRRRGESGNLLERKVGDILTSLHLMNRTRKNYGYVLWFNRETREEIHSLARTYGVNLAPSRELSVRCEQCEAMRERSKDDSKTRPIVKSERVEANDPRERREGRERGKRRIRRKSTRKRRWL
jgi:energy-coupling factor transporter ATP-binding protein EcfA2